MDRVLATCMAKDVWIPGVDLGGPHQLLVRRICGSALWTVFNEEFVRRLATVNWYVDRHAVRGSRDEQIQSAHVIQRSPSMPKIYH